jgi:hypothetical integral membrane protein (TIGR02206 family)
VGKYFSIDYLEGEFVLFGTSHVVVLLTLVVLNVLMIIWQRNVKNEAVKMGFRYALAALLILQEIALNLWRLSTGTWTAAKSLPLHLCGIALFVSAVALVTGNYRLFEIQYFWGLAGAIQPLLTPDSTYGFPHFRFFQVFVSHGALVTACIYMTLVVGYRPTLKSLWKAFLVTNAYMLIIAPFNLLVGGNYLFICHPPETPSLIDYLGPWPWYILSMEVVGVLFFFVFYAPFGIKDIVERRKRRQAKAMA